jgi:hypothetical protein
MDIRSLRPRPRLLVELTGAALFAAPSAIALWPPSPSFRSVLGVVAFAVVVFAAASLRPLARYGRAVGKRLPVFDVLLDIGLPI